MGSVGINKIVNDLFQRYDHNLDGKIQLKPQTYVETWENEHRSFRKIDDVKINGNTVTTTDGVQITVRKESGVKMVRLDERVRPTHGWRADEIRAGLQVQTQQGLFHAANANGDNELTQDELRQYISANYDGDKDGRLQEKFWGGGEYNNFNSDYKETKIIYSDGI